MLLKHKDTILDIIILLLRVSLGVTFIYASVHKIYDPYEFALQVATYQILPLSLVNLQAIILPWLEIITGMLLIAGAWVRSAALVTIGMNIMFIAAIAIALNAGLQLHCGCFASAEAGHDIDANLIMRDSFFILMGAALVYLGPDRFSVEKWIIKRRQNA
jgi:uncharacterized membrane protein YphA (DoxX/SURF4 family)